MIRVLRIIFAGYRQAGSGFREQFFKKDEELWKKDEPNGAVKSVSYSRRQGPLLVSATSGNSREEHMRAEEDVSC